MSLKRLKNLFEGAFNEISIDAEKRLVKNVALVGQTSKNGRRYTVEALKGGTTHYEGAKVFVDHPSKADEERGYRSTRDLAGKVENARFDGQKIRGDIRAINTDGGLLLFEIATNMPEVAGMSHNASGKFHKESGGVEVVDSIEKVFSVDLVSNPATNDGMFESELNDDTGEIEMLEYKEVTMVGLKEARNDLVSTLVQEGKESRDEEFQKVIVENAKLVKENEELQKKVDEMEVKEALAGKKAIIDKLLEESELPKEAITDVFRKSLETIEVKEGEKLEEKIGEMIDDRITAVTGKAGVKNNTERGKVKEGDVSPEQVAANLKA